MDTILEKFPLLSNQGIVNILRNKYNSLENAYLTELNKIPDKCIYCNENAKFISIFKGYSHICDNNDCKYKSHLNSRKRAAETLKVKDFIYTKCKVCEKTKLKIRNIKGGEGLNSRICKNEFCQLNKDKPFLNETHLIQNFKPYDIFYINK